MTILPTEGKERLRFANVGEALAYALENNLSVVEHLTYHRGDRLNCLTPGGRCRTLRIDNAGGPR